MVRKLVSVWIVAALAVAVSVGGTTAGDEKVPTTKEIMMKMNGKKDAPGLLKKSEDAGKGEKWEDAQKYAKEMGELAKAIVKNKPTKGEEESWKKKTKEFAETWAAIAVAAEAKNGKDHAEAIKKFRASCMECHEEHRPAKKKK
jgi:hypothetical protein